MLDDSVELPKKPTEVANTIASNYVRASSEHHRVRNMMRTASQRQSRQRQRMKDEVLRDLKKINGSRDGNEPAELESTSNHNLVQQSVKMEAANDSTAGPQEQPGSTLV